jgi:hypothetical protein
MELSPPAGEPIRFQGRVASELRSGPNAPPQHEFGIEFLSLDPEDDARLQLFIEALARGR